MEIFNIHALKKQNKEHQSNPYAPHPRARVLMCGTSGAGKTNCLTSIVMHNLDFDEIYIYSKHLNDDNDVYDILVKFVEKIEKKIRKKCKDDEFKMGYFSDDPDDILDVKELDPSKHKVVIFDDLMNDMNNDKELRNKIIEYFTSGRHANCQTYFLSQRYHNIPAVIRSNADMLVLFNSGSKMEQRLIANEVAEMPYKDFMEAYDKCMAEPYSFMVIDKHTQKPEMKIRKRFDGLIFKRD